VSALDLSRQRRASAPGEIRIDVAKASPLVLDQFDRGMHDLASRLHFAETDVYRLVKLSSCEELAVDEVV
jgi:hypothetical protein